MQNDVTFQYLKLVLDHLSFWPIVFLVALAYLHRRRDLLRALPQYVSEFSVGGASVKLRELNAQVAETRQRVVELENDLERENARFAEAVGAINIDLPAAQLSNVRATLKAMAPSFDDLDTIRKGFAQGATTEQLYASAELARARRDPALFDDLVACLDRLAADANLGGVRLYVVWTLTSALHRTLIADVKHTSRPSLTPQQLQGAVAMLGRLGANPRVLGDRPDAPLQGIRGPAKWATEWAEKGLKRLVDAPA